MSEKRKIKFQNPSIENLNLKSKEIESEIITITQNNLHYFQSTLKSDNVVTKSFNFNGTKLIRANDGTWENTNKKGETVYLIPPCTCYIRNGKVEDILHSVSKATAE
jgi:hypothetical protein